MTMTDNRLPIHGVLTALKPIIVTRISVAAARYRAFTAPMSAPRLRGIGRLKLWNRARPRVCIKANGLRFPVRS